MGGAKDARIMFAVVATWLENTELCIYLGRFKSMLVCKTKLYRRQSQKY